MNRNEVSPTSKEQKDSDSTVISNNHNLPVAHPDAVKPSQVYN